MMRRGLWMLLTALLLAAVIGDTIVWYVTVRQMRVGLADWVAAARGAGWSLAAATPQAGGWPLAATLILPNVAVRGGTDDIPNGLAWQAERVLVRLRLFHPLVLRIDAEGTQRLRVANAPQIPYTAGSLSLLVPLQAGPSGQPLHLDGEALRATVPVTGADGVLTIDRLVLDALLLPTAPKGQSAVSVVAEADGIGLPSRLKWALGPRITSAVVDGSLNGPLPEATGLTARATAWRDNGGSVEVRRLATQWGPLTLSATATLGLDQQLQPQGSGTAQVTGYAETLDALARNGVMSNAAATTVKAVLSLLAETPENGGPSQVEVPLSLQHRTLSMRQVPLVRLPELDWPQP
jgi:hypothetical protein